MLTFPSTHYYSTPHGKNHIGSLVVCLPSEFTGGDLVIRHDKSNYVVDFSNRVFDAEDESPQIVWAFLFNDCEHEVLPVNSGTRITLAYDVFQDDVKNITSSDQNQDSRSDKLKELLSDFKNDESNESLCLAFG